MSRRVRKTFYTTYITFHTENGKDSELTVNTKVETIADAIHQLSKQGIINAIVDCIIVEPLVYVMDNDTFRDNAKEIIHKNSYTVLDKQ